MRKIFNALMIAVILIIVGCAESPEPKVYTHEQAQFSVTCPAGWRLISQDEEMYEFRKGDVRLIEVGGFDFGMTAADFEDMTDADLKDFMQEASLGGFEGYCEEAQITNWAIDEQYHTAWGGTNAYRIRAKGFSNTAEVDMIVDLIAAVSVDKGMLYMFASQVAQEQYSSTQAEVEATIKSFQIR
jgi:hypothetical protein